MAPHPTPVHPGSLLQDILADGLAQWGDAAHTLTVDKAVVGRFFAAVQLSSGAAGMCSTLQTHTPSALYRANSANPAGQVNPAQGVENTAPAQLCGQSAAQALAHLHSPEPVQRALAIATLNAMIDNHWQAAGLPHDAQPIGQDTLPLLNIQPEDKVVMVGAFIPFIRALADRQKSLHVLELNPEALPPEFMHFYTPTPEAFAHIAQADVFIVTATTLLNDTADALLAMAGAHTRTAIIGPSCAMQTAPYARRGVQFLGGARIHDGERLLALLASGAPIQEVFRQCHERLTLRLTLPTRTTQHPRSAA